MEGIRSYKDKESAEENIFFKREEIKMLKSLAANARRRASSAAPRIFCSHHTVAQATAVQHVQRRGCAVAMTCSSSLASQQQLEDPKGYAVMVDKEKRELKQILSKVKRWTVSPHQSVPQCLHAHPPDLCSPCTGHSCSQTTPSSSLAAVQRVGGDP